MGVGIAVVAARAGYDVEVVEPQDAVRDRARSIPEPIRWVKSITAAVPAQIAIEAVPERFELKRDVFVALAQALPSNALLATNTSSLSVGDLADAVSQPERVVGLHFFNPPTRMQLVEIVRAAQTSDDALSRALDLVERLGKAAVVTADTPGFIVNRVARPYYLQALHALERGVASMEELDALARAVGFRMGPFELMDFIGLDINFGDDRVCVRADRGAAPSARGAAAADGRARPART